MIKNIKNCIFIIIITSLLSACYDTSVSSSSSVGDPPAVTSNIPQAVSSAGATKTITWTMTATANSNLSGYSFDSSPVSGTLLVQNNTCTGELLAGNSCSITLNYKAPSLVSHANNSTSSVTYQTPTFTYSNGKNPIQTTAYIDVFPAFYDIPQNASEVQSGPASNEVGIMAMNDKGCLYIATGNGLSISCDQGKTYSQRTVANGLPANELQDVKVNGQTVYVAINNTNNDPNTPITSSVAVSTDGGNNFTPLSLTSSWPSNAGNTHLSLNNNKTLYVIGSLSRYVAVQPQGGSVSLLPIDPTSSITMASYAIGSTANGTTYIDSYDSSGNPAVYSSTNNFTTPIFDYPTYPSDSYGFYNPKNSTITYIYSFGYFGNIDNNNMTTQPNLGTISLSSMNINQVAISGNYIYAALSNDNGLAYSADGGNTYTQINPNNLANSYVYMPSTDFLLNNVTDNNVYISEINDLNFKSNVGGIEVAPIGSTNFTTYTGTNPMPVYTDANGFELNTITALYTYNNGNQDVIFAGSLNGFEYSFDGGKTFTYIDTSSYGQVNAFAIVGNKLLVATSTSSSGDILSYNISLSKVLSTPTVVNSGNEVTDLKAQPGTNNVYAATNNGLLYSDNGGASFTITSTNSSPATSTNTWDKLALNDNTLYAVTANNEVYYGLLNSLPAINLTQATFGSSLASGTVPEELYIFNNTLYFATQGSGLLTAPITSSGPSQSLTQVSGLPSSGDVMGVFARTNTLNQTIVYALLNSHKSNDTTNGVYISNGSGSFSQYTTANSGLDSNMVNTITGTPSAIYVGTMGNTPNPSNPSSLINFNSTGNLCKLDLGS